MSDVNMITVDVREDLRLGREPFGRIMATATEVPECGRFRLLAPFEPVPLFSVLAKKGFGHTAHELEPGLWEIVFVKSATLGGPPENEGAATTTRSRPGAVESLEVDARGLEPPQPLVRILEAVESMSAHAILKARTDRRPLHLYDQLESRGFAAQSEEQDDGSYITIITRAHDA